MRETRRVMELVEEVMIIDGKMVEKELVRHKAYRPKCD